MIRRFKIVIFSPYFHSLIISLVIFFFLPDVFSKYEITESGEIQLSGIKDQISISDLDNDGSSEKIHSFFSTDSMHAVQIFNEDDAVLDQWNMRGDIPDVVNRIYIADFDHDSVKEVFAFSYHEDSLLVSCFDPYKKNEYIVHNRFIVRLDRNNGKPDFEISDIISADLNNDLTDELVFTINKRTTFKPRKIFVYDIALDSVWSSDNTGFALKELKLTDLNHDGIHEITGNNCASGNIDKKDSIQYSDYSAWLVLYDNRLKLIFKPNEFPGFHSNICTEQINIDSNNYLAAFYYHTGPDRYKPFLRLYNYSGEQMKHVNFPDTSICEREFFFWAGKKKTFYIADSRGCIFHLTENLQFKKISGLEYPIHPKPEIFCDLDGDGTNELMMFLKNNREGLIFREGFADPVQFPLPGNSKKTELKSVQFIQSDQTGPALLIQNNEIVKKYHYRFNWLWYLRYPVYPVIYFAVLGLVILIRYLQRLQMRERLRLQSDIAQLQMKAINQQIDPHFTFNAFNSIASLLKKEKGETAYNYFMRFIDLIRISLVTSDEIFRTLEDELTVVRNYLELQKLRFGDRFNYVIHVGDEIQMGQMIPKMIIQTYAENAVKHGFKNMTTGGLLKVEITKPDGNLLLVIEDNGIGRKKASETKSESTGLGISIMDRYIALLSKFSGLQIEKEIIDLYNDENEPAGTKVFIKIPVTEE